MSRSFNLIETRFLKIRLSSSKNILPSSVSCLYSRASAPTSVRQELHQKPCKSNFDSSPNKRGYLAARSKRNRAEQQFHVVSCRKTENNSCRNIKVLPSTYRSASTNTTVSANEAGILGHCFCVISLLETLHQSRDQKRSFSAIPLLYNSSK